MKSVVDASVALEWVLSEQDSHTELRLRTDFSQGTHQLLAPDVLSVEVAHALARAERRNIISPPQGAILLSDILTTLPQLFASLPLLPRAFAIASNARIGVYDCLYVALAERERCGFLTADDRLVRALQAQFPWIVSLASLP